MGDGELESVPGFRVQEMHWHPEVLRRIWPARQVAQILRGTSG